MNGRYILVLSEGFVLMGDVSITEHPNEIMLKNASTVRRWGTNAGLGQLAREGPQEETVLDVQPDTIVNRSQIKFAIEVTHKG